MWRSGGDHLRVCGADVGLFQTAYGVVGSPPRVRSRRNRLTFQLPRTGITSACAEQTRHPTCHRPPPRDHLRVCGADCSRPHSRRYTLGSPPRVRSRQRVAARRAGVHGITSACAEQTHPKPSVDGGVEDHLRVCGADSSRCCKILATVGSPPRVRSRLHAREPCGRYGGITSACAEQTQPPPGLSAVTWDHLRVCGADLGVSGFQPAVLGSPPRVRSRPCGH